MRDLASKKQGGTLPEEERHQVMNDLCPSHICVWARVHTYTRHTHIHTKEDRDVWDFEISHQTEVLQYWEQERGQVPSERHRIP